MTGKRGILYSLVFCLSVLSACKKEDTIATSDYKTLGTSAHALLAASPYSSLQIEIQYMPGYAIDTASISNLTNFLNTYINKPAGIQVFQRQINASGKSTFQKISRGPIPIPRADSCTSIGTLRRPASALRTSGSKP